jgi:hypothetical protein
MRDPATLPAWKTAAAAPLAAEQGKSNAARESHQQKSRLKKKKRSRQLQPVQISKQATTILESLDNSPPITNWMIETSTAFTEMEKLHLDHMKKSSPFQGCSASTSKL